MNILRELVKRVGVSGVDAYERVLLAVHDLEAREDARHLREFLPVPGTLPAVLHLSPDAVLLDEEYGSLQPEVIGSYESTWTQSRPDARRLDYLARGAFSLRPYLVEVEAGVFGEYVRALLDQVAERAQLPMVAIDLVPRHLEVMLDVLESGELTTREPLLAYNHGAWWALSLVDGAPRVKCQGVRFADWLATNLTARARRGVIPGHE